ncbi:unnamed protein product, partial [Brenthis ino]
MSSCPPQPPPPCPQTCPPPLPPPPCYVKPIMRRLHRTQTKKIIAQALLASMLAGSCVYFFIGVPRKAKYREYYAKGEFEDWADEMARKGLFQSVPKESLIDNQQKKNKYI